MSEIDTNPIRQMVESKGAVGFAEFSPETILCLCDALDEARENLADLGVAFERMNKPVVNTMALADLTAYLELQQRAEKAEAAIERVREVLRGAECSCGFGGECGCAYEALDAIGTVVRDGSDD